MNDTYNEVKQAIENLKVSLMNANIDSEFIDFTELETLVESDEHDKSFPDNYSGINCNSDFNDYCDDDDEN